MAAGRFQDEIAPVATAGKKARNPCHRRTPFIGSRWKSWPTRSGLLQIRRSPPEIPPASRMARGCHRRQRALHPTEPLKALARIAVVTAAGVDPKIMGIGPVPAIRKDGAKTSAQACRLDWSN